MIVVVERIYQAQYYEEIATQPMIEGTDAWEWHADTVDCIVIIVKIDVPFLSKFSF